MDQEEHRTIVRAVTTGPAHHFFGYYNITPWDATGRYMVALETDFSDRPPRPGDVARIGLIDTCENNAWRNVAETRAWNWQQGCMLQWLPSQPDRCIVYNDIVHGQTLAVVRDVFGGETRTLSRPVYAINHDGTEALSLNFARLHRLRPGYGYVEALDPTHGQSCSQDDGVYLMNMHTGESRLIISLQQLAELRPLASMRAATHWVNHLQFNTDDSRFMFLHRWGVLRGPAMRFLRRVRRKASRTLWPGGPVPRDRITRMLTARPDGSALRILADDGMLSHFDWRDTYHVLAWAHVRDRGDHYYLFDDRSGEAEVVAPDLLTRDGHCTFSANRSWVLTDTYPDPQTHMRQLILYHSGDNRRVEIGKFLSPRGLGGEIRCDLHPRWNRDGTSVCFDSVHEGSRQVYVADVREIVSAPK